MAVPEEVVQVSVKPDEPHICVVSLRQGLPLMVDLKQQTSEAAPYILQGAADVESVAGLPARTDA